MVSTRSPPMKKPSTNCSLQPDTRSSRNNLEFENLTNYLEHTLTSSLSTIRCMERILSQGLSLDGVRAAKIISALDRTYRISRNTQISLLDIENALLHGLDASSLNATKSAPKIGSSKGLSPTSRAIAKATTNSSVG